MVCKHCGNLLREDAVVCDQCGAEVRPPQSGQGVSGRRQGKASAERPQRVGSAVLPESQPYRADVWWKAAAGPAARAPAVPIIAGAPMRRLPRAARWAGNAGSASALYAG